MFGMLLSTGPAWADGAGQVMFVVGPVIATAPDDHSRRLQKGDAINAGDRITTQSGRVQIRFSDGGLVSLQPDTVLGVKQYAWTDDSLAAGSLRLDLIRGGVRATTGAIGHVGGSVYKVQTPVATFTVRGSEYLANYDGTMLQVADGQGALLLRNDRGSIRLLSGQAATVLANTVPMPVDDAPDIMAADPGDILVAEGSDKQLPYSASIGARLGGNGLPAGLQPPLPAPVVSLPSTVSGAPLYSLILAGRNAITTGSVGAAGVDQNVQATFAEGSGNLLAAATLSGPVFDNTGSSGALAYDSVGNDTVISFGEMSAGSSAAGGIVAAQGQYVPYIISVAGPAPATLGSVSYNLAAAGDATPARLYDSATGVSSSGTVQKFNITLDLTNLQLTLDLLVQMKGGAGSTGITGNFEASSHGVSIPGLLQNGGFTVDKLATTGPSGGICGSSGCETTVSGFFAGVSGARLGTAYDISTSAGPILGVAALTLSGPASITSTSPLGTSTNTIYSFATPTGTPTLTNDSSNYLYSGLQAVFAAAPSFSSPTAPPAGALQSLGTTSATSVFDNSGASPLQYDGLTTLGNLSYAELTHGSATLSLNGGTTSTTETLSATSFMPYIVGVTGSLPDTSLGTVHYTLEGGTTPRLNGTVAGTLNQFTIDLNLGQLLLSTNLQLTMSGSNYVVSATNLPVSGITQSGGGFMLTGLGVSGAACSSGGVCSADIGGFLVGAGATQMGAAYAINLPAGSGVINGVAALQQAPVAVAYSSGYGSSPTEVADKIGATGDLTGNSGLLGAANGASTLLQRTTATTVADEGRDGTLEWGRWTSGMPTVDGKATTAALNANDAVHYVVGQETPATVMNLLAAQSGSVTYNLEGQGTSPTNGSKTGNLQFGSLQVNFAEETMHVNLALSMGSQAYAINDTGKLTAGSPTFNFSQLATTGSGGACATACNATMSGFFAGAQADKVGVVYTITDTGSGSGAVRGAAGFGRP
jgi:hypothetical protein